MRFPATRLNSTTKQSAFSFPSVKHFDPNIRGPKKQYADFQSQHSFLELVSVRVVDFHPSERGNQIGRGQFSEAPGGCAADQDGHGGPGKRVRAPAPRAADDAERPEGARREVPEGRLGDVRGGPREVGKDIARRAA